jgi:glycosyltransferase involved in cell wall biosynthesis
MNMNTKLKIVAYVHGYFPNHNAGAEAMLHQILIDLKNKGHEVRVITRNPGADEYEGIPINEPNPITDAEIVRWSDIIFTHLDFTRTAVQYGKRYKKPVVHLVHNDRQLHYHNVFDTGSCALAIANSEWIKKSINRAIPSLVVYPPTIPERYTVESSHEYITLVNMNEAKGGNMFWQLARVMPEKQFLGVKGAYGEQVEFERKLPNVTILENTPNITDIYSKSNIVIMPSSYESWGRVAMEASCSGIPVIASPTPGLKESLDYAGIFADYNDVAAFVEAIRGLDDKKAYTKQSKLVKKRSIEVAKAFEQQMEVLEKKLIDLLPIV